MVKTSWLDNTVLSIAPIPLDDLKEYFANKELKFLINYENSTLKGDKFLTYLSNLDVPCDVIFSDKDKDSIFELVKEYMNTRMLVKLPTLEVITLQILLASKGIDNGLYYDNKLFSIAELKAFAEQNNANFPILSDEAKDVSRAYGVLASMGFSKRWTFYIDASGKIAKIDKA